MKRLILLLAALYISVGSLSAQSWLDALKGVASSAIDRATGGKLTANAIYGTWDYSQPGIKLSSEDDIISDLAASAATSTIQNKMAPYFEKVGIKAGVCKFTFNSDGTFSSTFGKRTHTGTFTFNPEDNSLSLKYDSSLLKLGAIPAFAYMNGTELQILFPMDKLLSLLQSLGSRSSSLSTITTLLNKYDSVKIGFEFSK